MCAAGSNRASACSMRAWMPPIQAWKSASATLTRVRLDRGGERLEHICLQDPDLLLRRLQAAVACARQLQAALVRRERLLQRELAAFHARHDFFQLRERLLEAQLA